MCSVSGREGQAEVEEQVRVAELVREGGVGATSCINMGSTWTCR